MTDRITIDGSMGEGGGQVLRTSLALSITTGKPFRITRIRAGRSRGGLLRQHITAVNAAAEVSGARVGGATIGSGELSFEPGKVSPGTYQFSVGTAGSATLVLQTVLPALMTGSAPSHLTLEGGTHNPYAPPFDFLEKSFLPFLKKMGAEISCHLDRPGFYPAGGGRFTVTVTPASELARVSLMERGALKRYECHAVVARLGKEIGLREVKTVCNLMGWDVECCQVTVRKDSQGPGNVLTIELVSENITEVFTGFGMRGVRAEEVAERAVKEAKRYLAAGVPVGVHLADQILLPMTLAGGGSFRTLSPSKHMLTNIEVIRNFLDVEIQCDSITDDVWEVTVGSENEKPAR